MESSAEEAILVLSKWKENSSTLRMVLGTDHASMTLHGTLVSVTAESLWAHGIDLKEDVRVSLAEAKFAFADERGLPPGSERLAQLAELDEIISIAWPDRTRLTFVLEKQKS